MRISAPHKRKPRLAHFWRLLESRQGSAEAATCMSSVTSEQELHALAAEAGVTLSPQLLSVVLELLRLDVTPQAVLMMLRRVMVHSVEIQRAQQGTSAQQ